MMCKSVWAVLLVCGTATWASAAPLNPQHIAAEAKWIIHVDMEAMRATAVGKLCREKCLAREDVRRHLDKIRKEIGIDPSKDLLGATLYDTELKKEHGVAMIHVRQLDGSRLVAKLNEKEPENRMLKYKKHKLYLWNKRHRDKEVTVCGTLYDSRTMIFSRDPLKVIGALEVLDDKSPGLGNDSRLARKVRPGTVVLLRGVDLSSSDIKMKCPILGDGSWIDVAMGASDGKSFAMMVLNTKSEETAKNATAVVNGVIAIARLRFGTHESFAKLLRNLEATASGTTLSVNWSANEEDVMKTLKR